MKSPYNNSALIVGITVLSVLSGLVGGVISQQYIDTRFEELRRVSLQDIIRPQTPKTKDAGQIGESLQKSIVRIQLPSQTDGNNDARFGTILSSDGWILSAPLKVKDLNTVSIVDSEGTMYKPSKEVVDTATGLSIIKIDAKSLHSVGLDQNPRYSITEAFAFFDRDIVSKLTLSPLRYPSGPLIDGVPLESDTFNKEYVLGTYRLPVGLPIVNESEEVVAFSKGASLVPALYIQPILADVINKGAIARPRLNIQYRDLSTGLFQSKEKNGALLTADRKNLSGDKGAVTLQKGDVIAQINGETLDQNRNLSEILSQYRPGETITLLIKKTNGTQASYRITL